MTVAFLLLAAFGIFATLCSTAPVWDDEVEAPASETVGVAERA